MRVGLLLAACMAVLFGGAPASAQSRCSMDREALLALDYRAFDQDMFGGWRHYVYTDCRREAAELLAAYRVRHVAGLSAREARMLRWHEAQVRAEMDETPTAIALFETTRSGDAAWDAYVDATLAFLRRDREALVRAREALLAVPKPAHWDQMRTDYEKKTGRVEAWIVWPQNLSVIDRFVLCFEKSYREAYAGCS